MAALTAALYGATHTKLSEAQVNILYTILHRFDIAATSLDLRYYMATGTALGAVLRGGLIPWDTDADLFLFDSEFHTVLPRLTYELQKMQIRIKTHTEDPSTSPIGWYKLFYNDVEYPNVDIYLLHWNPTRNVWMPSDGYMSKILPKRYLDFDQIFSSTRIPFGPLNLPIFAYPERFFDRYYGTNWRYVWNEKQLESSGDGGAARFPDYRPALPTIEFNA